MSTRNIIAFILIIISLLCLYPGLTAPVLSVKVGALLPIMGNVTFYESTQSILKTISTLHENNNSLVAFLILFFSIIVPIIKAVLLLVVLFFKQVKKRLSVYQFVYLIGKWSMADVFVVGVFLAFLATKSNDNIEAQIHQGFYFFLAYCLISLMAIQVMKVED